MTDALLGRQNLGTQILLPTLGLALALLAVLAAKRLDRLAKGVCLAAVVFLVIAPAVLPLRIGGPAPLRAQQAVPISVATLWMLAAYTFQPRVLRGAISPPRCCSA